MYIYYNITKYYIISLPSFCKIVGKIWQKNILYHYQTKITYIYNIYFIILFTAFIILFFLINNWLTYNFYSFEHYKFYSYLLFMHNIILSCAFSSQLITFYFVVYFNFTLTYIIFICNDNDVLKTNSFHPEK